MPLPPGDGEEKTSDESSEPKLQFSYMECLIFTFHQLVKTVSLIQLFLYFHILFIYLHVIMYLFLLFLLFIF